MGKAFRNQESFLILLGQFYTVPLAVSFATRTQIHHHIENATLNGANQISLKILLLKMLSAKYTLGGHTLVSLHKENIQTLLCHPLQLALVKVTVLYPYPTFFFGYTPTYSANLLTFLKNNHSVLVQALSTTKIFVCTFTFASSVAVKSSSFSTRYFFKSLNSLIICAPLPHCRNSPIPHSCKLYIREVLLLRNIYICRKFSLSTFTYKTLYTTLQTFSDLLVG